MARDDDSSTRRGTGRQDDNDTPPRASVQGRKSEIIINVYDLLPPGKLSNMLWTLGSSLLHTGVYITCLKREYAFGGHNRRDMSGVYWTRPHTEPPGGTMRCEILHGFTFETADEIEKVVRRVSDNFMGQSYNLLSNNCNHFTSRLCKELTGREAPSWLNRAARVGVALPCVVPQEWLAPPDYETADGHLVKSTESRIDHGADEEDDEDERTSMLRQDYKRAVSSFHGSQYTEDEDDSSVFVQDDAEDGVEEAGALSSKARGKLPVRT